MTTRLHWKIITLCVIGRLQPYYTRCRGDIAFFAFAHA